MSRLKRSAPRAQSQPGAATTCKRIKREPSCDSMPSTAPFTSSLEPDLPRPLALSSEQLMPPPHPSFIEIEEDHEPNLQLLEESLQQLLEPPFSSPTEIATDRPKRSTAFTELLYRLMRAPTPNPAQLANNRRPKISRMSRPRAERSCSSSLFVSSRPVTPSPAPQATSSLAPKPLTQTLESSQTASQSIAPETQHAPQIIYYNPPQMDSANDATQPRDPSVLSQHTMLVLNALETGAPQPGLTRSIKSLDCLGIWEIAKLFEILHECGKATDPDATRTTTREAMVSFATAVFKGWSCDDGAELQRPELATTVQVCVDVGYICINNSIETCEGTRCCHPHTGQEIMACAWYDFKHKTMTTQLEPKNGDEPVCALLGDEIHWKKRDWGATLRESLTDKTFAKIRKHNKNLAIWHARVLIQDWAQGGFYMGESVSAMGFITREKVDRALTGLMMRG